MLDEDGALHWMPFAEIGVAESIFLGLDDGIPLFAPLVRTEAVGRRAWSVFRLIAMMSGRDAAIWGAARSLNEWHNRHIYCGVCGNRTESFRAGWGRKCHNCDAEHFPRVDPVVIMLAEHEDRILLGRSPHYPPGRYSALAGFVEPGESIEEAVARELFEEAGVAVRDVRYVTSQPWPFPSSLMIGLIGRKESGAISIDAAELEDARWFSKGELEDMVADAHADGLKVPRPAAIAHHLIRAAMEEL